MLFAEFSWVREKRQGDLPDTYADRSELEKAVGYKPSTPVKEGEANFVQWYREFYGV